MNQPPRTWPDGRPVGGENGYPPAWAEYTLYCQAKFVAGEMLRAQRGSREAVFAEWQKKLPGVARERVKEALQELKGQ